MGKSHPHIQDDISPMGMELRKPKVEQSCFKSFIGLRSWGPPTPLGVEGALGPWECEHNTHQYLGNSANMDLIHQA